MQVASTCISVVLCFDFCQESEKKKRGERKEAVFIKCFGEMNDER
jgi:hypothetical protein